MINLTCDETYKIQTRELLPSDKLLTAEHKKNPTFFKYKQPNKILASHLLVINSAISIHFIQRILIFAYTVFIFFECFVIKTTSFLMAKNSY